MPSRSQALITAVEPRRPGRLDRAVGREAADLPRLVPGIALRAAALEVEADRQQAVRAIGGQGGDELARAALGVPVAVGIGPGAARRRILVVGDGVGHAAVEQQALDAMALPAPAGVGRCAVDRKAAVGDRDGGGHLAGARASWPAHILFFGTARVPRLMTRHGGSRAPGKDIRTRRPRRRGGFPRRRDRGRPRGSAR